MEKDLKTYVPKQTDARKEPVEHRYVKPQKKEPFPSSGA